MTSSSATSVGFVPPGRPLKMATLFGASAWSAPKATPAWPTASKMSSTLPIRAVRPGERRVARRHVVAPEATHEPRALAVLRLERVHERLEVSRREHHGREQADWTGAEHEGAHVGGLPGVTTKDRLELEGRLGRDRQGLDEHRHLGQHLRDRDQVLFCPRRSAPS